ncbi:hypothetical protein KR51_00025300 [Rubidibacter lacunae KORDI 51-2]|uniref:Uncharacterized protein n=1 Tax=Rubidibacter lacunae KORDI 51-2 TaxID=582515 RepID=U5DH48_9CHRO|nr:hypothetical protein KR51_00025300 [Rubidibacter lacunae KORDI 51-2]
MKLETIQGKVMGKRWAVTVKGLRSSVVISSQDESLFKYFKGS